ncbi:MAG TPA: hypothetical protein VFL83_15200 [Anaeromyxobacter sp.]|nr:hypothetical protein [Anaeromyxobacter sp.]
MSTFFSTLAQVNATLLGILAAAVAAMYVFLQERASRYEESIDQALRDQMLRTGALGRLALPAAS